MSTAKEIQTPNSTIDQQRAAHALESIRKLADSDGPPGHYVSYVSALPAVIVTNGLGQALATELAKAKGNGSDPHYLLYTHIADWLSQQVDKLEGEADTLIDRLMDNDQEVYLRAQIETMAYLHWLKQFARAYLEEKEGQSE